MPMDFTQACREACRRWGPMGFATLRTHPAGLIVVGYEQQDASGGIELVAMGASYESWERAFAEADRRAVRP